VSNALLAEQARALLERREAKRKLAKLRLDNLRGTLGTKQQAFMRSKARRRTLGGSRQSGKSHTLATTLIDVAFASKCTSMYVAPTSKSARAALWSKLHALNDEHKLGITMKEGHFRAVFPNGSEIGFEGAHDTARVKRLRGAPLSGVLCVDEAAFFPEPIIRELMGPTCSAMFLASPNGQRIVVASSPGLQRRGYCYELMHEKTDAWEPHALFVHDNPVIKDPAGALAELRAANAWTETTPVYMREGLGLWVDDASHNVYELTDLNLIDGFPDARWTTLIVFDFGKNDQSAIAIVGWRDHDPALYLLHVEGHSDLDIEDLCLLAKPLVERYAPIAFYGDPGGGGAQHMDYMRKRHQFPMRPVSKRQNYKKAAIDAFNTDARRGFVRVLRASPLVEQMQALQWDPVKYAKGEHEEHASMPNDLCDVTLYGHMHAQHFRAEDKPPPPPPMGSKEHLEQLADEGLKAAIARANQHNAEAEEIRSDLTLLLGADTD
jgi:phage terminase large subunit-like protein